MMLIHLQEYKQIFNGKPYKEVRKRIYRIEKFFFVFFVSFFIMINILSLSYASIQLIKQCNHKAFDPETNQNFIDSSESKECQVFLIIHNMFWYYYLPIMYGLVIVSGIIILSLLMRQMQSNLYYYYQEIKWKLVTLILVRIFYQAELLITIIPWRYTHLMPDHEFYLNNFPINYSVGEILIAWFINLLTYLPLYFLAYYNIKNINFNLYIQVIMSGYGIADHYDESSIFISKAKVITNSIVEGEIDRESNYLERTDYKILSETQQANHSIPDVFNTIDEMSEDTENSQMQNMYKVNYESYINSSGEITPK